MIFLKKQSSSGIMLDSKFFKWCIQEVDDEKDTIILRQKNKIYSIEKCIKGLENGLHYC